MIKSFFSKAKIARFRDRTDTVKSFDLLRDVTTAWFRLVWTAYGFSNNFANCAVFANLFSKTKVYTQQRELQIHISYFSVENDHYFLFKSISPRKRLKSQSKTQL